MNKKIGIIIAALALIVLGVLFAVLRKDTKEPPLSPAEEPTPAVSGEATTADPAVMGTNSWIRMTSSLRMWSEAGTEIFFFPVFIVKVIFETTFCWYKA